MPDPAPPLEISPATIIILVAVLAGGLSAWVWIARQLASGRGLLPYEPRTAVPWGGKELLLIVLVFVVASVSASAAAQQITGVDLLDPSPQQMLILIAANALASVITLSLAVVLLRARTGATGYDFGIQANRAVDDLSIGFVTFLAVAPIVYALQAALEKLVPYEHPLIDAVQAKPDLITLGFTVTAAVIVAPVAEEFFFRVLLQGWLEKYSARPPLPRPLPGEALDQAASVEPEEINPSASRAQRAVPIILSSSLFALSHWGHGAAPIPLFLFSIVLGLLYQRTHRLLPSVFAHLLLNLTSIALFVSQLK